MSEDTLSLLFSKEMSEGLSSGAHRGVRDREKKEKKEQK